MRELREEYESRGHSLDIFSELECVDSQTVLSSCW